MALKASWKTTALGGAMLAVTLITNVLVPWLRGDGVDVGGVLANPELINHISNLLMGLLGGLIGVVARDNTVTSEQALGLEEKITNATAPRR